jgi:hypothetical protein
VSDPIDPAELEAARARIASRIVMTSSRVIARFRWTALIRPPSMAASARREAPLDDRPSPDYEVGDGSDVGAGCDGSVIAGARSTMTIRGPRASAEESVS